MRAKITKSSFQGPGALLILFIIFCLVFQANAQRNKDYILQNTDRKALQEMAVRFAGEYQREYEYAVKIAKEKGWPVENLVRIDRWGLPVYLEPTNAVASQVTGTTALRSNYGVQGDGMNIGLWEAFDGGNYAARATHQDLTGRVTIMDGGNISPSSHGTHVAGTLIGSGWGSASAKGMAPHATLDSYDANSDLSEMATAANAGLLVSNHSYGFPGGWKYDGLGSCFLGDFKRWTWLGPPDQFITGGDDPDFGWYDATARSLDDLCRAATMYLPVFSAGNGGNKDPEESWWQGCDDEVRNGESGSYVDYETDIHPPGNSSQRSTITLDKNAKNILVIGNLEDNLVINGSSSRGMSDDGRIKPDLCGNGTELYSTESSADNAYGYKTGTSMASPNVAGSLLLLQQLYEEMGGGNGIYMRAATLKGLVIATAGDLGNPGPDFTYGWGVLSANDAGWVIDENFNGSLHKIFEENNPNGFSYTFYNDGNIKVTLCYTDVAGAIQTVHNDPTPRLVNDLDIRLVSTGGATYYPYVLSMTNPSSPATTGDNDRDNVEQIYATSLPNGKYTVNVNVEGSLTGQQPFSLIVQGIFDFCSGDILDLGGGTIGSGVYYESQLLCHGAVNNGSNVEFAGKSIKLTPGFTAQSGSEFNAVAQGCD
ncbi:MAG: S8 family serine peptidase [Bacteroidales bacterium]|nr:S8 family serine peptidase [Bacteroidales bacterium]